MRYFLFTVSALALAACETTHSEKPEAGSDVVVTTGARAAKPVAKAPPAPPSPVAEYRNWDGTVTYGQPAAAAYPAPSASFTCWDGSRVFNSGQCPTQPSSLASYSYGAVLSGNALPIGSLANVGNGRTLERVTDEGGTERYVLRSADGMIIREFVDREAFEKFATNPYKRVVDDPVSTFSSDVDTASYAVARRDLKAGRMPRKDAIRIEEILNYFDYDYPNPRSKRDPFSPTINIVPSPWNTQTELVHIGVQGYTPPKSKRPPMNLVFLVDTSGSMNAENKLPLLKKSLNVLLENLEPEDRVSIVTYGPRMETVLVPTPGNRTADIKAALNPLTAQGSTNGEAGLQKAYQVAEQSFIRNGTNRVILATDGDFNIGISDPAELKTFIESKRETDVYLSVLGFGNGNLKDDRMQSMAQNGNGVAYYIDSLNEAEKVFGTDFSKSLVPIADDLKLQVEFNPNLVSEYRLLGYETRALARQDFNNDKVDAGDIGAGHSVTAIYEILPYGASSGFVDPLRYGQVEPSAPRSEFGDEYGFLKLRYKRPGEDVSNLMSTPIIRGDAFKALSLAPRDTRWAVAVAGYGMALRGDDYAEDINLRQLSKIAQDAKGRDRYGYRSEFLDLMKILDALKE